MAEGLFGRIGIEFGTETGILFGLTTDEAVCSGVTSASASIVAETAASTSAENEEPYEKALRRFREEFLLFLPRRPLSPMVTNGSTTKEVGGFWLWNDETL